MVATLKKRGAPSRALSYFRSCLLERYYLASNNELGVWMGRASKVLGLTDQISVEYLRRALNGVDPLTGRRLVNRAKTANIMSGVDLVLSAPKAVSVLWALSSDKERSQIEQAHFNAVSETLSFVERDLLKSRRGRGGLREEGIAGALVARFAHKINRSSEPQLHDHLFILNLARRLDGSWGAIEPRHLFKRQKEIGLRYRTILADQIILLGYDVNFSADAFSLAGLPRELEMAFSQRRQAIVRQAEALGVHSPQDLDKIAIATRRRKREHTPIELTNTWHEVAKLAGFDPSQASNLRRAPTVDERGGLPKKPLGFRNVERIIPQSFNLMDRSSWLPALANAARRVRDLINQNARLDEMKIAPSKEANWVRRVGVAAIEFGKSIGISRQKLTKQRIEL